MYFYSPMGGKRHGGLSGTLVHGSSGLASSPGQGRFTLTVSQCLSPATNVNGYQRIVVRN